jgi:hypothetical protein
LTYKTIIARELILLGEFKAADAHLSEVVARGDVGHTPQVMSALQNHLVNQINLGTYQKGVKIYQQYKDEMMSSGHARTFDLHLSYLYLFLGKDEQALSQLPAPAGMIPLHQIHIRHAYMIAFILHSDLGIAQAHRVR